MPLCYLRMGDNSKKNRSRLRGPAGRRRKIRCSIYHPSHISHGHICHIRILIELKHTRWPPAVENKCDLLAVALFVVRALCVLFACAKNRRRPDAGRRHRFCPPMQRENPLVCKGKFRLFFRTKTHFWQSLTHSNMKNVTLGRRMFEYRLRTYDGAH